MLPDELRRQLADTDDLAFASAVQRLHKAAGSAVAPEVLLVDALSAVGTAPISAAQQSRRAAIIVHQVRTDLDWGAGLLHQLRALPRAVRTGIARSLPARVATALYNQSDVACQNPGASGQSPAASERVAPTSGPEAAMASEAPTVPVSTQPPGRGVAVVLLSALDNQDANVRLLRSDGFGAYRVPDTAALKQYLASTDVCGFVVDGSFWSDMSPEEQGSVLSSITDYSSLASLVIDRSGCHLADSVHGVVRSRRLREPNWHQLQIRDHSRLSASDIECFRISARFIASGDQPQLVPGDLSPAQTTAVMATARSFFQDAYPRTRESLHSIWYRTIQGGRSGAKLLMLHFNECGWPVIAKVDSREMIWGEVDRFDTYIRRWDRLLQPYAQFHGGVGAIIFGLIEDASLPLAPAPTLDDKLNQLWLDEIWQGDPDRVSKECTGLLTAIERTCQKLAALNTQPCDAGRHKSFAYMRASSLRNLIGIGAQWSLSSPAKRPIEDCIARAHDMVAPLQQAATVHGDLHLMNVLVPREGDPYIIDYAYSGPGHPAYDLVRLECCLYFRFLRPLGGEDDFVRLQEAISRELADEADLRTRFPIWWSCPLNGLLLRGALAARDQCLRVLKEYGAGHDQYLAAKFVMCCWSLCLPLLQWGLVRGAVRALAPALGNDSVTVGRA